MKRAVFLDRDGVINRAYLKNGVPVPPKNLSEVIILPKVKESLEELHLAKYILIIVTNQPDVARGKTQISEVNKINDFLYKNLPIDAIKTCYHDNSDLCSCRKPLPGLLINAAAEYNISMEKSYMIGDRWRDIEAGKAVQCKTFFIDYSYLEKKPSSPDYVVNSLYDAKNIILGELK